MKTSPILAALALLACLVVTGRGSFAGLPRWPASSEPIFSRASLTDTGLCFESPEQMSWEVLARRRFAASTLANPPRDQVKWFYATGFLTFATDLPASLRGASFYILSETGVVMAPAPHLSVTVVYRKALGGTDAPTLSGFDGELCVKPPPGVSDAGFVVSSSQPLELHTTAATITRSGANTLVGVAGKSTILPPSSSKAVAVEVKTAYVLGSRGSSTQYLFVRRAASCAQACCEFAYDLYRWDLGLTELTTSAYGCDV